MAAKLNQTQIQSAFFAICVADWLTALQLWHTNFTHSINTHKLHTIHFKMLSLVQHLDLLLFHCLLKERLLYSGIPSQYFDASSYDYINNFCLLTLVYAASIVIYFADSHELFSSSWSYSQLWYYTFRCILCIKMVHPVNKKKYDTINCSFFFFFYDPRRYLSNFLSRIG